MYWGFILDIFLNFRRAYKTSYIPKFWLTWDSGLYLINTKNMFPGDNAEAVNNINETVEKNMETIGE